MESFNYFNYFTEIEDYFWRKRGAHLLVSPLDWAIVETWQKNKLQDAAARAEMCIRDRYNGCAYT